MVAEYTKWVAEYTKVVAEYTKIKLNKLSVFSACLAEYTKLAFFFA